MRHANHIILLVAIVLLGTVICQQKPKLPSRWWATAQMTKGSPNLEEPMWFLWIDNGNRDVPRAKFTTVYHDEANIISTMAIGNTAYQLFQNSTAAPQCYTSPLDKSAFSLIQQIINFLDGAEFEGTINQNGVTCNSWINYLDSEKGYFVSGCFLTNGTPVSFEVTIEAGVYVLVLYEYGTQYYPDPVFSIPNPANCITNHQ